MTSPLPADLPSPHLDLRVMPPAGRSDEFLTLPDLLDVVRDGGFVVLRTHEATLDEWDAFESGHVARFARSRAAHAAAHAEAARVRERMQAQQATQFRGYRGVLGMAYLQLLAA